MNPTPNAKSSLRLGNPGYFTRREIGAFPKFYRQNHETRSVLYSQFLAHNLHPGKDFNAKYGGVFGLDFSLDGSVLGAAMEKRTLLFFDPLSQKVIHKVSDAHSDCSNAIKFLDNRIFVSCSDDNLVKLWDLRYLKHSIRIFRGHSNWVKNIEYDSSNGFLLTSGFDGYVYSWDINNYGENSETEYRRVFYTPGLMRTKLTPDLSKLIISTHWGYLLIVHNFDIHRCGEDLADFKPNMYWIMLKSGAKFVNWEENLKHFKSSRNCVELIIDFPSTNDPDNITSITPHPHSWCILTRNTNHDERSEFTCVHDIQLPPVEELNEPAENRQSVQVPAVCLNAEGERLTNQPRVLRTTTSSGRTIIAIDMYSNNNSNDSNLPSDAPSSSNDSENSSAAGLTTEVSNISSGTSDDDVSPVFDGRRLRPRSTMHQSRAILLPRHNSDPQRQRMVLILSNGGREEAQPPSATNAAEESSSIPKTYKRLLYYVEEPNVGRGFIKEQAFSSDGRLIASPFGFGVRFLAFSDDFKELCDCDTAQMHLHPRKLSETGTNISHRNNVLCARFSPVHLLLATGCLGGKVAFHQPVL